MNPRGGSWSQDFVESGRCHAVVDFEALGNVKVYSSLEI